MHDLDNDSMVQSKYAVIATTVTPYRYDRGRVKLEDEAFDFRVSMAEIERLGKCVEWINLSFVERKRTPE